MTLEQNRIYVTVDVLPLSVYEGTLYILLSRRKDPPYQERWALPGRFVDAEESAEAAAGRLIHEMLPSGGGYLEQLYTFSELNRDPRGRVISMAYLQIIPWKELQASVFRGGASMACFEVDLDDQGLRLRSGDETILTGGDLAFDHGKIIETGIRRLRGKIDYTEIGFRFLANMGAFSLSELQNVFEAELGENIDKSNFRRTIINRYGKTGKLKQTDLPVRRGQGRPAALYSMTMEGNAR